MYVYMHVCMYLRKYVYIHSLATSKFNDRMYLLILVRLLTLHTYINTYMHTALAFRPENLYILMPIAGYAYVFHHSIPSLAHPVPETHKSSLNMIFSTAILISFAAYVCMAVTVSSYFKQDTLSPSNLNWAEYIG